MPRVKIVISPLITPTGEEAELEVSATTLKSALEGLTEVYGKSFRRRIFHKDGELACIVFLNGANVWSAEQLDAHLKGNDRITLIVGSGGG